MQGDMEDPLEVCNCYMPMLQESMLSSILTLILILKWTESFGKNREEKENKFVRYSLLPLLVPLFPLGVMKETKARERLKK